MSRLSVGGISPGCPPLGPPLRKVVSIAKFQCIICSISLYIYKLMSFTQLNMSWNQLTKYKLASSHAYQLLMSRLKRGVSKVLHCFHKSVYHNGPKFYFKENIVL